MPDIPPVVLGSVAGLSKLSWSCVLKSLLGFDGCLVKETFSQFLAQHQEQ